MDQVFLLAKYEIVTLLSKNEKKTKISTKNEKKWGAMKKNEKMKKNEE